MSKTKPTPTLKALRSLAKKKKYELDLYDGLDLLPMAQDARPYIRIAFYDERLDRGLALVAAYAALSAIPDADAKAGRSKA